MPGSLLPALETHFASQLHIVPTTETDFLQFNAKVRPFDDVRVRQALNLAIDRRVIAGFYGGHDVATPTCQVLPAGLPGYRRYCPYTRNPGSDGIWSAPDLARPQRLVTASGTRGARITFWGTTDDPTISPPVVLYTASVLRRLGYRTRVHLVRGAYFTNAPPSLFKTIQLIPSSWLDTTPYNFFAPWLSCTGALDHGWFCDPRLDSQIRQARSLEPRDPRAAASLWAAIDRGFVDQAAWVPFVSPRQINFVSARVRNFQNHAYWGH